VNWKKLPRRAGNEHGVVLVLALVVLFVLAIVLATTVEFTTAGARNAGRSNASQKAYALAEGGINNAIGVIEGVANPTLSSVLPSTCSTPSTGSASWCGTISGSYTDWTWTLTSIGSVANPTGAAAVTRTITAQVKIHGVFGPSGSNFLYSAGPVTLSGSAVIQEPLVTPSGVGLSLQNTNQIQLSAGGTSIGGNITGAGTWWIGLPSDGPPAWTLGTAIAATGSVGSIVVNNAPSSLPSTGELQIGSEVFAYSAYAGGTHTFTISSRAYNQTSMQAHAVGDPVEGRLSSLHVGGSVATPGFVHAVTQDSTLNTWTPPATPTAYAFTNAAPGPKQPGSCLTGTSPTGVSYVSLSFDSEPSSTATANHSLGGNQNISPQNNDYDCSATAPDGSTGRIAWNHSTKVLTVKGSVFFDGDVVTQADLLYSAVGGSATITTTGTFTPAGNVCGAGSASACDTSNWNPMTNELSIVMGNCTPAACNSVGHDLTISASRTIQGLFWTDGAFTANGGANFQGSVIAKTGLTMTATSGTPALAYPVAPPGVTTGFEYTISSVQGNYGG
jgi:Flp pilus assembly protein TadG